MITKHNLSDEFPEFSERITSLKATNAHFKKLFETYDELEQSIYRIETDTEPTSDNVLNNLRIERVSLKDEIYQFIIRH
ncbi:YdcH family protein [Flavobacterium sp. NRK F10]|uniref:GTP-binding protein n=1 Tax=Flavobacterium sediminis TaxID=2201181 RepID=A0A2U8QW69_9FLAO|nr:MULTISPECIES: YdcH family protein [Flavobacterium]AWM14450.1 hypothetical protein DI487_11675 [Flavobacterium sediminis]MCO6175680.1 YdcH family protein [Flavobacterium sp. NRK F10]